MQICSTGVNACAVHTFSWESVACEYAAFSSCHTMLLSIHYNTIHKYEWIQLIEVSQKYISPSQFGL